MKIEIGSVEGETKGSKSFRTLELIKSETNNFYWSTCGKFTIWDLNGDWTKIGISKTNVRRYSYTTDFKIEL